MGFRTIDNGKILLLDPSVTMRLYSMHKRHFVAVFAMFFTAFGLALCIGVAGPPITVTAGLKGSDTVSQNGSLAKGGPFMLASPTLSLYSQQLWLIALVHTDTSAEETVEARVSVAVTVDAVTESHSTVSIVSHDSLHNRSRTVICHGSDCQPIILVHLGYMEHPHYVVQCYLTGLHHNIKDIDFYFKTYNPAFTQIEIWFRFIFLLSTFSVTIWFCYCLRQFAIADWSTEQKWISLLLPLLLLYNDPIFPMTFLIDSWFGAALDAMFQASFLCALLLFWLCMFHAIRQTERKILTFYGPKIAIVAPLWFTAVIVAACERIAEQKDPTFSYTLNSYNFYNFKVFFVVIMSGYLLYLSYLVIKAYTELRAMPFFGLRLRLLTVLMVVVMCAVVGVTMCKYGTLAPLEDAFAAQLSTSYKNSVHFMATYSLLNFYVYTMAYIYSPVQRTIFDYSSIRTML